VAFYGFLYKVLSSLILRASFIRAVPVTPGKKFIFSPPAFIRAVPVTPGEKIILSPPAYTFCANKQ